MSEVLTTPYEEAKELQASGANADTIAARLQSRGLDAEAIVLLLNAIGARPLTGPLPTTAPVAQPVVSPHVPELGPPPTTTCTRCGVFLERTWAPVLGKAYCSVCAARPDVNYPRAYRDANWGKRDGFSTFLGISGLCGLLLGGIAVLQPGFSGVPVLIGSFGSLMFWTGAKSGRTALVVTTIIAVLIGLGSTPVPNLVTIGLTVAALRNTRTKLFFEIEVSEAELEAAWRAEHDNLMAQYSRALGLIALATTITWTTSLWQVGFATLVIGVLAVITGVIGLRNVNPQAQPPVARKGAATLGLVTGAIAVLSAGIYLALPYF